MELTFRPTGNATLVTGSTTATGAVQISSGSVQGAMFVNSGAADAFVTVGSSTVAATMPTSGAASNGFLLLGRSYKTVGVGPNLYYSVIAATAAGAPVVTVTPGIGL
jgi:hypothetical protein